MFVPLIFDVHIESAMTMGYFRLSSRSGSPPWLKIRDEVKNWLDDQEISYRVIWQGYEASQIIFDHEEDAVLFKLKF